MVTFVLIRKWLLAYRRQRGYGNIPSATCRSGIDIQGQSQGSGAKVKWGTDCQAARDKVVLSKRVFAGRNERQLKKIVYKLQALSILRFG